jgi:hypothetical protein
MYPDNQTLDRLMDDYRDMLMLLTELKEKRARESNHRVVSFIPNKKKPGISAVECSCGKVTKYRKPLTVIADFECPNSRR